jgi:hypothetical protein
MHRATRLTQLNGGTEKAVRLMDQFLLKTAPQCNGNHTRNTLRFLYWLSGGIILYLLRNSSEARDKCKLEFFFPFL